mgnify:CR=1 FL=1
MPIYGHNMSDGGVFADFAKYGDEEYARSHSVIDLYTRDGQKRELEVIAVDIVNANAETMCPDFDDSEEIARQIAKSDIVLAEYDCASNVFAFTTCSYQTANSRTVVYASPIAHDAYTCHRKKNQVGSRFLRFPGLRWKDEPWTICSEACSISTGTVS